MLSVPSSYVLDVMKPEMQTPDFSRVCAVVAPFWPRYETTSSDDSSSEDSSSSGSDEEEEEEDEEKEYREKEEHKNVEGKSTWEDFQPEGAEDVDKKEDKERSEKRETRERWVKNEHSWSEDVKRDHFSFHCFDLLWTMGSDVIWDGDIAVILLTCPLLQYVYVC